MFFTPFDDPFSIDPARWDKASATRLLAEVVGAETEAEREADRVTNPGDMVSRGLLSLPDDEPIHASTRRHWYDYLSSPAVVARCAEKLLLPQHEFLQRVLDELPHPPNWQVFFWMFKFYETLPRTDQILAAANQYISGLEQQGVQRAKSGGRAKDAVMFQGARTFVQDEWALHQQTYRNNKSHFARYYVAKVFENFAVRVTERTITTSWLKDK